MPDQPRTAGPGPHGPLPDMPDRNYPGHARRLPEPEIIEHIGAPRLRYVTGDDDAVDRIEVLCACPAEHVLASMHPLDYPDSEWRQAMAIPDQNLVTCSGPDTDPPPEITDDHHAWHGSDDELDAAVHPMVVDLAQGIAAAAGPRRTIASLRRALDLLEREIPEDEREHAHQSPAADSAPVVHACPDEGDALTPCCNRSPFGLPRGHVLTGDDTMVTCGKVAYGQHAYRPPDADGAPCCAYAPDHPVHQAPEGG